MLRMISCLCALVLVAACASPPGSSSDDAALTDAGSRGDASSPPSDAGAIDATISDARAPGDSGSTASDGGSLGPPEWVDIEVRTSGTCAAVSACGGDVMGTWDVAGGCVEVPVEAPLSECPGASVTRRDGRARGRVHFDGVVARRVAESEVEVEVLVPSLCASFAGGCPGIQAAMRAQAPDSTCTASASGDCTCIARQTTSIDDTDTYTTTATEIVGTTKRWRYCIASDVLSYQDSSPSGPREPGVIRLGRRD